MIAATGNPSPTTTQGERVWITPDPGLYGPASEAWRLNREATLLLAAGPRALLLQIAHPLIAEGVDQHSDFRADPWARLQGTLRSFLRIVYGSTAAARGEIRRLNTLHRTIGGPVRDESARAVHGPSYAARDPDLSLWVHATLVDSTIVAWDRWVTPYPRAARARFYEETKPIGRALGIPATHLPRDLAAFEAYIERMLAPNGPIHPTATARVLARRVLNPPLGPVMPALARLPSPLYAWTLWPSVGLLPPRVRDEFGLVWGFASDSRRRGSSLPGAPGARSFRGGSAGCRRRRRRIVGWAADLCPSGAQYRRGNRDSKLGTRFSGVCASSVSRRDLVGAIAKRLAAIHARRPFQNAVDPIRVRRSLRKLPPWM